MLLAKATKVKKLLKAQDKDKNLKKNKDINSLIAKRTSYNTRGQMAYKKYISLRIEAKYNFKIV